jgi:hypothetical protein
LRFGPCLCKSAVCCWLVGQGAVQWSDANCEQENGEGGGHEGSFISLSIPEFLELHTTRSLNGWAGCRLVVAMAMRMQECASDEI